MRWILSRRRRATAAHSCGYGDDAGMRADGLGTADHSALACYYEKWRKSKLLANDVVPGWRIAIRPGIQAE